jgi:hypothetical protein
MQQWCRHQLRAHRDPAIGQPAVVLAYLRPFLPRQQRLLLPYHQRMGSSGAAARLLGLSQLLYLYLYVPFKSGCAGGVTLNSIQSLIL